MRRCIILSYAYPTPKKKISVASLQLETSANVDFEHIHGIGVLNVVLPKIYSKFIAGKSTFSINFCTVAFVVLMHYSAMPL